MAETLGMTVDSLRNSMSLEEMYGWNAYFSIKNKREEEAYEKAQKKAQYRKVR